MLDSCAQSPRRRDGMHTNTHMQTCCTQGRLDAGPLPLNICWHFCALSDLWWQANHRVLLWRQPSLTLSVSHTCMHRHNQSVALHESCRRQSRGDRSLWAKWKKAAAQLLWKGIQHWVHFSCAVRCVKISAEGLHCWVILFYSYFSNRNVILLLLMDELPSKPASLDNNGTFDSCGVCAVWRSLRWGCGGKYHKYLLYDVVWDELCSQPRQECGQCAHTSINLSIQPPLSGAKTKHFIKSAV